MTAPILSTSGLSKIYGAIAAVNNIAIDFEPGKVHAVIGPNGAGKTTLINLLSGDAEPTEGTITFKGQDITHLAVNEVSQLGVGRSYQKTNIFPHLTCLQNCWAGAQSRMKTSMRFFRPAKAYKDVQARAEKALSMCNLEGRANTMASAMSYGEQRQLEIGMMLATEPELLLLDEPLAGMGTEEADEAVNLIKRLAKEHTIILIEHDMDAVFAVADTLTVMVNGTELKTGTPEEIKSSTEVQKAYLGVEEDDA